MVSYITIMLRYKTTCIICTQCIAKKNKFMRNELNANLKQINDEQKFILSHISIIK